MVEITNTGGEKRFVNFGKNKLLRESKPKNRRISFDLTLTDFFKKSLQNFKIELTKINYNFCEVIIQKNREEVEYPLIKYESTTNEQGISHFKNIDLGTYYVKIFTNKLLLEKVITLSEDSEKISIKMPLLFNIFKKKLNKEELKNVYEQIREDLNYCFSCNGKYYDFTDRFKCHHCEKYFCSDHHLPESHKCEDFKK